VEESRLGGQRRIQGRNRPESRTCNSWLLYTKWQNRRGRTDLKERKRRGFRAIFVKPSESSYRARAVQLKTRRQKREGIARPIYQAERKDRVSRAPSLVAQTEGRKSRDDPEEDVCLLKSHSEA